MRSSHVTLDQVDVAFDDQRAVASAGGGDGSEGGLVPSRLVAATVKV